MPRSLDQGIKCAPAPRRREFVFLFSFSYTRSILCLTPSVAMKFSVAATLATLAATDTAIAVPTIARSNPHQVCVGSCSSPFRPFCSSLPLLPTRNRASYNTDLYPVRGSRCRQAAAGQGPPSKYCTVQCGARYLLLGQCGATRLVHGPAGEHGGCAGHGQDYNQGSMPFRYQGGWPLGVEGIQRHR